MFLHPLSTVGGKHRHPSSQRAVCSEIAIGVRDTRHSSVYSSSIHRASSAPRIYSSNTLWPTSKTNCWLLPALMRSPGTRAGWRRCRLSLRGGALAGVRDVGALRGEEGAGALALTMERRKEKRKYTCAFCLHLWSDLSPMTSLIQSVIPRITGWVFASPTLRATRCNFTLLMVTLHLARPPQHPPPHKPCLILSECCAHTLSVRLELRLRAP